VKLPAFISEHIPLAAHTTLRVGGAARYFCTVTNESQLREAIAFAQQVGVLWAVIGGGSNILVSDEGYAGLVIVMAIRGQRYQDGDGETLLFTAGAGEILDEVIAETVSHGWWGLENLSHIPGTVGAVPIQNVGAYGVEVSDYIHEVTIYDTRQHAVITFDVDACQFGYRDSYFKRDGGHLVVLSVTFRLSVVPRPVVSYADLRARLGDTPSQREIRDCIIAIRSKKFPDWSVVGTAGSFFKNPIITRVEGERLQQQYPTLPLYEVAPGTVKVPLGFILDVICQLKGVRMGNVGLYHEQALVLVAYDNATASEIDIFVSHVTEIVFEKTKIKIEREVMLLKNKK
jgi:UDP-N-acetylmuramate dehydrogenase